MTTRFFIAFLTVTLVGLAGCGGEKEKPEPKVGGNMNLDLKSLPNPGPLTGQPEVNKKAAGGANAE
jgi:hypothetical protein